jgi:hypothetical protein
MDEHDSKKHDGEGASVGEKVAEQQAMRDAQDRLAGKEGETAAEEHRGGPLPNTKR